MRRRVNPFLALVRLTLNNNLSLTALRRTVRSNPRVLLRTGLLVLALGVGFTPWIKALVEIQTTMYHQFSAVGQGRIILLLSFLLGQLMVFFFGLYYLMAAFYYARDLDILVPLPLKPQEILGAKFIAVMVNEYLTLAPFILPGLLVYGLNSPVEPVYWPLALLAYLIAPVVPLAMAAIILLPVMRFTNLRGNRDLLRVGFSIVLLVLVLGLQFYANRYLGNLSTEEIGRLIFQGEGDELITLLGRRFPPAVWLTQMAAARTVGSVLRGLVLTLASAGISLMILGWLGRTNFYGGVVGSGETPRRRVRGRRSAAVDLEGLRASGGVFPAMLRREVRLFYRNPIFLVNGLLNLLIPPLVLVLMLVAGGEGLGTAPDLNDVLASDPRAGPLISLGLGGFIAVIAALNQVAGTAISREGGTIWISRSIPTHPGLQVAAKLMHGLAYTLMGATLPLGLAVIVFSMPTYCVVVGGALGLAGGIAGAALGLMIDLHRPWLDWDDPQRAMKGNNNNLIVMALTAGWIALVGFVAVRLMRFASPWAVVWVVQAIMVLLAVILVMRTLRLAPRAYAAMET